MRKHLVLVGGGHAHMVTLENISRFVEKGAKVTVIAPSSYHYYSGMGPGMLGRTYGPDEIRFATQQVVTAQGGVFVRDYVDRIDPVGHKLFTRSGNEFDYDVVSFNAGSHVDQAIVAEGEKRPDNVCPVKPIEALMAASDRLAALFKAGPVQVSVVGGGPSSAEISGNVLQLAAKTGGQVPRVRIFAGRTFMKGFHPGVRDRVRKILARKGVEIVEQGYVAQVEKDRVILDNGDGFETDFTFMASGVSPSEMFERAGLAVGPDKGLLVNQYLQAVDHADIFGGGDCISFSPKPLDKVGVYAVRENPVLLHNLMAALEGRELMSFDPGPDYLLIFNLGGGKGVLKKHGLVFGGRIAFMIKDYIDRKFIRRFQAIEKKR